MIAGPDDLFAEVAADHPQVARRESADTVEYAIGDQGFVVLSGRSSEFRLRPEMVSAALRTAGTRPSARGADWVAFDAPSELERYDVDRLRAWFEMAARLAGG